MKARLMGFEWHLGQGITLSALMARLHGLRDTKVDFRNYDRLLYICESGDYFTGLFLTVKDQRKFAEVESNGRTYHISVRDIERGKNVVDFNFFIIHKRTCRGLYLYYHQSCSLNQFSYFCKHEYDKLKDMLISEAATEAGGVSASAAIVKRIKREFKGSLMCKTMVRRESVPQLLDELDMIKTFEFDFFAVQANMPVFTPYDGTAKRMSHRISFKPDIPLHRRKQSILASITAGRLSHGRIEGRTGDLDRVIRLIDNPDCFATYDHDYVADHMRVDLDSLASSWGVAQLLAVARQHQAVFEAPIV